MKGSEQDDRRIGADRPTGTTVGEVIDTGRRRVTGPADWSFLRRPRWILSHLFAATLIVAFVGAGFWQLDRLEQRQDSNARVESRALQVAVPLETVVGADGDELDFVAVTSTGRFIESELARVANRSQDGRGGDWAVGIFETDGGQLLAVNRGFVLRSETVAAAPEGNVELEGFLRLSRTKGWIGGNDNPDADRMPRLNIDDLTTRLDAAGLGDGRPLVPLWLQLSTIDGVSPAAVSPDAGVDAVVTPRPVPLDDLSEGNHLSYAVQWFLLATLSVVVYGLLLRRIARRPPGRNPTEE